MDDRNKSGQLGASLMEVLIVLAIAAILTTVAVTNFGKSNRVFDRQNIAREFKVNLERARYDSVKRRAFDPSDQSKVTLLSATSYSYTVDLNQNGVLDSPGESVTINFGARGNNDVTIVGTNFVYPVNLTFNQRGELTLTNGTTTPTIAPIFYVCTGGCTPSTANASNSDKIMVSPTGTVSMIGGGDSFPTFTAPSATPSPAADINPYTNVWTDSIISPTATPSGSPFSSATATVTATATSTATATFTPTRTNTPTPVATLTPIFTPTFTATPTATITATFTPTPYVCASGQKPALTGCTCVAPMFVRTNGKCM